MTQPGHFLPNFIDWMERVAHTPQALKATHREVLAHMKRANRNGVRFALDDVPPDVMPDNPYVIGADLRPPFPITIIEYEGGSWDNVIIVEDMVTHVKLRAYAAKDDLGVSTCPFEVRLEYVDHPVEVEMRCWSDATVTRQLELRSQTREDQYEAAATLLKRFVSVYARLCAVLENHEVETTDVPPDDRANRVRRIKGQAPLYTYKTLVIGAPKKRQAVRGGGTHASPRSHLRRGYYRTSRNGVRHWVQACMVMGETPGFVHKDYKVEPQGEVQ